MNPLVTTGSDFIESLLGLTPQAVVPGRACRLRWEDFMLPSSFREPRSSMIGGSDLPRND